VVAANPEGLRLPGVLAGVVQMQHHSDVAAGVRNDARPSAEFIGVDDVSESLERARRRELENGGSVHHVHGASHVARIGVLLAGDEGGRDGAERPAGAGQRPAPLDLVPDVPIHEQIDGVALGKIPVVRDEDVVLGGHGRNGSAEGREGGEEGKSQHFFYSWVYRAAVCRRRRDSTPLERFCQ
jgi:hypothetical protein